MNFPDLSFTIGNIKITPLFISILLSVIFSLFSLWRKLKGDDVPEVEVYKLSILLILFGYLGYFLSSLLIPYSFLGCYWAVVLCLFLRFKKKQINYWEGFEALCGPEILFLIFGGIGLILKTGDLKYLSILAVGVISAVLKIVFEKNYRRFVWYKSGKPGIVFWLVSLFVFACLFGLAFWFNNTLYLNLIFTGISVIAVLIIIYKRSERKPKEDWNSLFKKK